MDERCSFADLATSAFGQSTSRESCVSTEHGPPPALPDQPAPSGGSHVKHTSRRSRLRSSAIATLFVSAFLTAGMLSPVYAQPPAKKALGVEDYTKWRAINGSSISGDGKWVTYVLAYSNTAPADAKPVMHLVRLDKNQDTEIANATSPAFSADSRWVAYQIDPGAGGRGGRGGRGGGAPAGGAPAAQGARGGQGGPPTTPRRVELRNLET